MATQRKLSVGLATFPYAGTSSGSSLCWDIVPWLLRVQRFCDQDPRIDRFVVRAFNDTPITMTRNEAVLWARSAGMDVLVMVDADMAPDCEAGDPNAKPFFPTSFDEIYDKWDAGPRAICAPYCGPPPYSSPYVFKWASGFSGLPDVGFNLEMIGREEAARLGGILECAAQPTGLIMFDMRIFDLTDPEKMKARESDPTKLHSQGWFYYEWENDYAANKGSTEDVTATRDLSLNGHVLLGREVLFCNWDAWAGHNKVFCVRKPTPLGANQISERFKAAVERNVRTDRKLVNVKYGAVDGSGT